MAREEWRDAQAAGLFVHVYILSTGRSTRDQDAFLPQRVKVKSSQGACSKSLLSQQLWGADAERTLSKSGAGAERTAAGKGVHDGGQGNKTRRTSDSPL